MVSSVKSESQIIMANRVVQKSRIVYFFPLSLFFLMMFVPQTHQEIKYVLLFFSLIFGIFPVNSSDFYYSKKFIFWFCVYIGFYVIWIFWGFINGNPGVVDFFRVQVVWPFLFLVLMRYINSEKITYQLFKIMIITSFIISTYDIYRFLAFIDIVPKLYDLKDDFNVGIHPGFIQVVSLNFSSLLFLFPFLMGATTLPNDFLKKINISKTFLLVALLFSILCSILSGRRIFWIILIFNIIITFLFLLVFKRSRRLLYKLFITITLAASVFLILFGGLNERLNLDYNVIKARVLAELDSSSDTPRNEQKIALLDGFYENPIIGTGFGVGVKNIVRSEERDWTYELTYHLYLYNTGIIGITIYFFCLVYPLVWSVYLLRKDASLSNIIFPVIIGYMSVLIASSTNPIMTSSFDLQWMIFLPIGILNCLEITSAKQAFKPKQLQPS